MEACALSYQMHPPYSCLQVQCSLLRLDSSPLASLVYSRIGRTDELEAWRPAQVVPYLDHHLVSVIASAPTLLMVQLGPWEYEDGCHDLHSFHDSLCNNTRPWLLSSFVKRCSLIFSAIDRAYSREVGRGGVRARERSMVVVRTETPRDFDGGTWKQGGKCRRTQPYERLTGLSRRSLSGFDEWRGLEPSSMRFAVQSKNLIVAAVAAQRAPWVRLLDAYEIARLRPDAHPGPRKSIKYKDDCLHYCLPGIPDIFNGRLLALMQENVGAIDTVLVRCSSGGAICCHRGRITLPSTFAHLQASLHTLPFFTFAPFYSQLSIRTFPFPPSGNNWPSLTFLFPPASSRSPLHIAYSSSHTPVTPSWYR